MDGHGRFVLNAFCAILIAACRSSDQPRPIPECEDYARAFARCQAEWIGADAGTAQARAFHKYVMHQVADAGESERTALADACRTAGQQLAHRCSKANEEEKR